MALDQVDVDGPEKKTGDEMSFWEHLEELRSRLIKAILAITVGVVAVFASGDWVFEKIIYAPRNPGFVTYQMMNWLSVKLNMPSLAMKPIPVKMIAIEMGEPFFKQTQVAIILGLVIASPYVFWQLWQFIKPGLKEKEAKAASGFVGICSGLFLFGVLFGYFIIAPFAISFLSSYTIGGVGGENVTLNSYIGYMTMFTLPIGLVFELPIIIYLLARLGVVSADFLKKYRRQMIVILLIVAGVITPGPDVVSQLLVFVPLYSLYEIGILVAKRVHKQKQLETAIENPIS